MISAFITLWLAANKYLILGCLSFFVFGAIVYRTIGKSYFDDDPKLDQQEKIKIIFSSIGTIIFLALGSSLLISYFT